MLVKLTPSQIRKISEVLRDKRIALGKQEQEEWRARNASKIGASKEPNVTKGSRQAREIEELSQIGDTLAEALTASMLQREDR